MMSSASQVTILIVDDDELDARGVKRALHKQKISNPVRVAHDGIEALDVLRGTGGKEKLSGPYIILLDLNMPRMNGLQFLHELRADENLATSIVFVLTTSNDDQDRLSAYKEHVAGYLLKSNAGRDFMQVVEMLKMFVLSVEFPPDRTRN